MLLNIIYGCMTCKWFQTVSFKDKFNVLCFTAGLPTSAGRWNKHGFSQCVVLVLILLPGKETNFLLLLWVLDFDLDNLCCYMQQSVVDAAEWVCSALKAILNQPIFLCRVCQSEQKSYKVWSEKLISFKYNENLQ